MPRKPKFDHPVRQVRTCLNYTQPAFAKLLGCSAVAIERIENNAMKLSQKLATIIMDATGADPDSLLAGIGAKAKDMLGHPYTKESYDLYRNAKPCSDNNLHITINEIGSHAALLLLGAKNNEFRTRVVTSALRRCIANLADEFQLKDAITKFLIEKGQCDKRIYRVSDLRKFPDYARILKFEDSKKYEPESFVTFTVPRGWHYDYILWEIAHLPPGADMKLHPNAEYLLDANRPTPEICKDAIAQALYWEIKHFELHERD